MITVDQMRKIEILGQDSLWYEVTLGQLTEGDTIRMFEPDGTPVEAEGATVFTLTSRPAFQANFDKPALPAGTSFKSNSQSEPTVSLTYNTNNADSMAALQQPLSVEDAVIKSEQPEDFIDATPAFASEESAVIPDDSASVAEETSGATE